MIVELPSEDRWDAIVNHFSLDTMEEDEFLAYIGKMGYTIDADDEIIENLHDMWENNLNNL